jgi:hypothetical protein
MAEFQELMLFRPHPSDIDGRLISKATPEELRGKHSSSVNKMWNLSPSSLLLDNLMHNLRAERFTNHGSSTVVWSCR